MIRFVHELKLNYVWSMLAMLKAQSRLADIPLSS
jgi:hypothetical protein